MKPFLIKILFRPLLNPLIPLLLSSWNDSFGKAQLLTMSSFCVGLPGTVSDTRCLCVENMEQLEFDKSFSFGHHACKD